MYIFLFVSQGGWDEDELDRLRQVYSETCEIVPGEEAEREKLLVQQVSEHFPHRGVRDIARQMREEGWLERKEKHGGKRRRRKGEEEEDGEGKRSKFSVCVISY